MCIGHLPCGYRLIVFVRMLMLGMLGLCRGRDLLRGRLPRNN